MYLQPSNRTLRAPGELRFDLTRLVVVRFGVLIVALGLAWVVVSQFGRIALEGLGMATPEMDWGRSALRSALLGFVCFAGGSIANLIGQRAGHPVGAAMFAMTCRTGGVAVIVLAYWQVFDRPVAKAELAILVFLYGVAFIADTLSWLIEIRMAYETPRSAKQT